MRYVLNTSRQVYMNKINLAQDYIEKHLAEALTVEQLAAIASFSPFHFQRIYRQITGESLYAYIKRLRLEKAAFLLLGNKERSIQDIALSLGFANQASFAKAFKGKFGKSASEFRRLDGQKGNKIQKTDVSKNGKVYDEKIKYTIPIELSVQTMTPTHVVYVRHTGPYKGDSTLFKRLFTKLYTYAQLKNYVKSDSKWYAVYHDFGDLTMEEQLRVSACMSTHEGVETEGEYGSMILEGGKYAVGRFLLKDNAYQLAWNYMLSKWLPESGCVPDDRMFFEYFPPQDYGGGKEERMVDIFIPITPLS